VNADSKFDIFIKEVTGDMEVGLIQTPGDVFLTALDGSILDGEDDDIIDVSGHNLTFDVAGSIGTPANALDIEATGLVNMSAGTDILLEVSGDLVSDSIVSKNGSVDLLISNGNGILNNVAASDTVIVKVDGQSLDVNSIDASKVLLNVTEEGSQLNVENLFVSEYLLAYADYINLPNVVHTNIANDLRINIAGNDGGMANDLNIITHSTGNVIFDTIKASLFDLVFTTDSVNFLNIQVGEKGSIRTPNHLVWIDNVNRMLYPDATTQLFTEWPFNLRLTDQHLLFTNADIIHYDPTYIVNNFSTENSLTRLVMKRDSLPEETRDNFELVQKSIESRELVDNMASGDLVFYDPNDLLNVEGEVESEEDLVIFE
jgi:hypothetical protein